MIADQLNLDPAEVRIKNGMAPGDVSLHGWEIKSCGLQECVERATESAGWREKRGRREPYTGIGIACCNHVSGNRAFSREFDGSAGVVHIGRDGRILVFHGESDMGQGQKTAFAQIVAERLGVPLEMVHVAMVDTDVSPFGMGSFATRGTLMGGNGVLAAADNAYQQLAGVAAEMLDAHPDTIECRNGEFYVRDSDRAGVHFKRVAEQATLERMGAPIIGYGTYDPGTVLPDPVTKYGNISPAYPFACQIAEVKVDPDTGQVEVVRITAAHDVGRAINPMATEGQIHGGVTQGLGWALMEDMVVEGGRIVNDNMLDYVIPTALDMPEITPILVEPIDPSGPYGAKGIGEPALNPTMAAVTNAIYNATGIRVTRLPVSAEEILAKLGKLSD
jgi:CO/xanthine dehydrogenase Mo-binding subunit